MRELWRGEEGEFSMAAMAQGQSAFDRVLPVSVDALYVAARDSIGTLKARKGKLQSDDFARSIDFQTRGTFGGTGAHGHVWAAQALPDPGGARLHMTASVRWAQLGGTSDKWAAKVAAAIFEDVSKRCATTSAS